MSSNEMPVLPPNHVDEDFEDAVETPSEVGEILDIIDEEILALTERDDYVGAPVVILPEPGGVSLVKFADGTTFRVTVEKIS